MLVFHNLFVIIFFASPKKTIQKKGAFYEGVFYAFLSNT